MITIQNLTKEFKGNAILKQIDLNIPQGETVAIVGPSGSGKSTLLRCINHLDTPSQGCISINGTNVSPENLLSIRKKVGMVFQHFHLFPHMTVLENIIYSPVQTLKLEKNKAIDKAQKLLKKVGLPDKANVHPSSLSGGQKQRIAIARALAMEPEVILFDEPTSALDPEMVNEVLQVIKDLSHEGMTVLIVTHEMGFAKNVADRILFLDQGQIIEDSSPDSFFKNPKSKRAQQFLRNMLHVV